MVARLVAMIKYGVQHNIVQNPTQVPHSSKASLSAWRLSPFTL
jgi:hypothetical protein